MKTFLTLFWIAVASSLCAQAYFDTIFTQHFQQDGPGWIASDGAISLALPDGRSMWFMGDSHVDQALNEDGELPCLFNTRNSILVQDSLERDLFTTYYNADGDDIYDRQFVKMEGDSNATYWPGDAIMIEDTIYSFWQKFEADSEAVFGISFSTMVIAKIKYPEVELLEVEAIQYPGVEYGMSVVWNEEDQYFYLYGKYLDWIVFKPMLARCTADQLLGEWEFYDGTSWSTDPSAAAAIAPEVSAAYSVFYLNEQYHLFYQESGYLECGLGRDMYIYSADNPWGPFEEKTLVYTMENQFEGEYPITYNGEAHPQFIENDELLISYNVNQLCPNDCQTTPFTSTYDPDRYRPKFARIPLCTFAKDVEAPIINCALDTVVLADSSGIFTFTDDSLAPLMSTDNCTDSVRISNSLNGTPSLIGSSLSPGTVEVVWTALDNSGNTNSCSISITVDMPANTSEPDPKLAIKLYPNPATEKLYIADPNQIINHLSLYDASGKQLTPQLAGDENALDVSSLAQGMYVLKLHLSDSILIKRFIVH